MSEVFSDHGWMPGKAKVGQTGFGEISGDVRKPDVWLRRTSRIARGLEGIWPGASAVRPADSSILDSDFFRAADGCKPT